MTSELALVRLVASLLKGKRVRIDDGELSRSALKGLVADGVLRVEGNEVFTTPETRSWFRRNRRSIGNPGPKLPDPPAPGFDPEESPLARLARPTGGQVPFLSPHQIEAGERFRRLVDRARMVQRTTMSYDPARTPADRPAAGRADASDSALDARAELGRLLSALPADCGGVLLDVCGYLKGLQLVEVERRWPRRSAKLVLRIALEQLAVLYGLSPVAREQDHGRGRTWRPDGARPTQFG